MRSQIMGLPEPARFLIAGSAAALLNWFVRFPLSLALPFAYAVALANVIGMVFGFLCYRMFVFPNSNRELRQQLIHFVLVNLLSMIVVVGVSVLFSDYILPFMGWHWQTEAVSHAFGIAAGAVSNFYGHRHWSFASD